MKVKLLSTKSFANVEPGEVFEFGGTFFLKLGSPRRIYDVVNLSNGVDCEFGDPTRRVVIIEGQFVQGA